jgi:hypothetical protein
VAIQKDRQRRANPALIFAADGNTARVQKQAKRKEKREEDL